MQLQKIQDIRAIEIEERRPAVLMGAGLTIGGFIGLIVGVVVYFVMMRFGVYFSATIRDVIPTDTLTNLSNETLTSIDTAEQKVYNLATVVPIVIIMISLIALFAGIVAMFSG